MKKPLLWLTVFCALTIDAKTLNVRDFGIIPGKDVTFAVNRLLESLQNEPNVTLVFPKGQYDFYPENAREVYRAVSNHDNGLKRMAFPIFGNKNITIDGNGSLFMMHGRLVPITVESVDGVTLKNFSIDFIRPFHAELKCVERDIKNNSAIFEINPELFPYKIQQGELLFERFGQEDPIGGNIVFDPETRAPIYDTRHYVIQSWKARASRTEKNRVKLSNCFPGEPPPVGSVAIGYGVHPTSRLVPAIHVTNSKDLVIENVTVYAAGGMGLIVERTENCTLNRMNVTSSDDLLVSTRADATHFIGCKGLIQVENCLFEHMLDDAINVHGAYVPVAEHLGNNQFICNISHFQQWGLTFGESGDKIALMSRLTVLPFFETTITQVKPLNEHRFVLTVAELPNELPDIPMSVENLSWNPDLIFRNNIVRENRARSILVTTKGKVLIENNTLSSQMQGILIEGDNNHWYESGAVQDVTIRNNEFINPGVLKDARYPLNASPLLTGSQHTGEGCYHRNIRFENNKIKSFNGLMVKACSVQGLIISGNTIELSKDYPRTEEGPAIALEYCDDVVIKDNTSIGFKALSIESSNDVQQIQFENNEGFTAR